MLICLLLIVMGLSYTFDTISVSSIVFAQNGMFDDLDDDEDEEEDDEPKLIIIDFGDHSKELPNYPKFSVKAEGYPPFKIKGKIRSTEYFKCSECHDGEELVPRYKIRKLRKRHKEIKLNHIKLDHGNEKYWCTTCHDMAKPNYLKGLKGEVIHFDQSFLLCGQCHGRNQKDWLFGVHGKRVGNWSGERVITLCTECHNQHSPAIKQGKPNPPPFARKGHLIVRDTPKEKHHKIWEQKESHK